MTSTDKALSFDRSNAADAISRLNEADLRFLNQIIVQRLRLLAQARTTMYMAEFTPGDRVRFMTREGEFVDGFVQRLNHKSVSVIDDEGGRWNVSPGLLQKVDG